MTLHDAEAVRADLNGVCSVLQVGDIVLPVFGAVDDKNVLTVKVPNGSYTNVYTFTFDGNNVAGDLQDPAGNSASVSVMRTMTKRRSAGR